MTDLSTYYDESYPPSLWGGGPTPLPDPHIDSIDPVSGVVGVAVTVTITGTNFVPGSVVEADQAALPTVYVNATTLTVSGTPLTPGTATLTVRNPNDEESNGVVFTVTAVAGATLTAKARKALDDQAIEWNFDDEPEDEPEVVSEDAEDD